MEGSVVKKLKVVEEEEEDKETKLKALRLRLCNLWGKIVQKFYEKDVYNEHLHCLLCMVDEELKTEWKDPCHAGDLIEGILTSDYETSCQMEHYMLGLLNN